MGPLMSTYNLSDVSWVLLDTRPWIIPLLNSSEEKIDPAYLSLCEPTLLEQWTEWCQLRDYWAFATTLFPSHRPGLCQSIWEHSWTSWFSVFNSHSKLQALSSPSLQLKRTFIYTQVKMFSSSKTIITFQWLLSDREKAPKKPQSSY